MGRLGDTMLQSNDQAIIAGYGRQYKDDYGSIPRHLKLARFKIFGYSASKFFYRSNYLQSCPGRS